MTATSRHNWTHRKLTLLNHILIPTSSQMLSRCASLPSKKPKLPQPSGHQILRPRIYPNPTRQPRCLIPEPHPTLCHQQMKTASRPNAPLPLKRLSLSHLPQHQTLRSRIYPNRIRQLRFPQPPQHPGRIPLWTRVRNKVVIRIQRGRNNQRLER